MYMYIEGERKRERERERCIHIPGHGLRMARVAPPRRGSRGRLLARDQGRELRPGPQHGAAGTEGGEARQEPRREGRRGLRGRGAMLPHVLVPRLLAVRLRLLLLPDGLLRASAHGGRRRGCPGQPPGGAVGLRPRRRRRHRGIIISSMIIMNIIIIIIIIICSSSSSSSSSRSSSIIILILFYY